jgi:hypothetical protein
MVLLMLLLLPLLLLASWWHTQVKVALLLSLNPKRAHTKNMFCTQTLGQWWSSISPQNKFSQLLMVSGVVLHFFRN